MATIFYSKELIEFTLRDLNMTHDSIVGTADLFMKLGSEGGNFNQLSEDWAKFFKSSSSDTEKQLVLIYLANDIVQRCSNPKFKESLKPSLVDIFESVSDVEVIKAGVALINLWRERKIFSEVSLKEMQRSLLRNMNQGKLDALEESELKEDLLDIPKEAVEFVNRKNELEILGFKTAESESLLTSMLSRNYDRGQAFKVLNEYRKNLEAEAKCRGDLIESEMQLMQNMDAQHIYLSTTVKKMSSMCFQLADLILEAERHSATH